MRIKENVFPKSEEKNQSTNWKNEKEQKKKKKRKEIWKHFVESSSLVVLTYILYTPLNTS